MRIFQTTFGACTRSLAVLFLVFGGASVCSANTTYDVNLTIGAATVSGYIVTDGKLGVLNPLGLPSDIIDWNLLLNDPTHYVGGFPCSYLPCTVDLTGPNNTGGINGYQTADVFGADLTATATQLLFNFSGTDGGYIYFETGNYGAVCFETTTDCLAPAFGAGESLYIDPNHDFDSDYQYTSLLGTQVIGNVSSAPSVPEPSTFILLGMAITLAGFRKIALLGLRKSK